MNGKLIRTVTAFVGLLSLVTLTGQQCTLLTSSKQSDGGVFRSDDAGSTWKQKAFIGKVKKKTLTIAGYDAGIFVFNPVTPSTVFFGTIGHGLYRSEDSGERWQVTGRQTGSVVAMVIDPETPEILYAGNGGNIEKTTDGAVTWQKVYTETRAGVSITSVVLDPKDPGHIFASNTGGIVLESRDHGITWQVNHVFPRAITALKFFPNKPSTIFAVLSKKSIARTDDYGEHWITLEKSFTVAGSEHVNDLVFSDSDPVIIYIATNAGLFSSNDLGTSFMEIKTLLANKTLPIMTVFTPKNDTNALYFTATNKLHISNDKGENWKVITIPTTGRVTKLTADPSNQSRMFLGLQTIKK